MSATCELCRRDSLEFAYAPHDPARALKVTICAHCGLVQSLPRSDDAAEDIAHDAKALRAGAVLALLKRHADLNAELTLLDVASQSGSFVRAFLDAAPSASVTAAEAHGCDRLERVERIGARIEDAALETARFHIVHSCRTLERLAEPARVLADHWRVLKPGGLLILDTANIARLACDDAADEWFADNQLYHFSARTLMRLLEACGFGIVAAPDIADRENLLLVARKSLKAHRAIEADPREVGEAQDLLAGYVAARARTLAADLAGKVVAMKPAHARKAA
jgi:2-polyprenyl-3-methyl-5-hydroxy-6-metoxy-1,4-benzoquinol methylase